MISCTVLVKDESVRYIVQLSLNGQESGLVSKDRPPVYFTVICPAPTLLSATLSQTGAQIIVTFDRDVHVPVEYSQRCRHILASYTVLQLGANDDVICTWRSLVEMIINLRVGATIEPNDNVILKNGTLRAYNQTFVKYSSGFVALQAAQDYVKPVPIITGKTTGH